MSFVVRVKKPVQAKQVNVRSTPNPQQLPAQDPPDVGSFLWGVVAGGIITLVAEGALIYVTWPILVGFVKTVGLAETVKEAL